MNPAFLRACNPAKIAVQLGVTFLSGVRIYWHRDGMTHFHSIYQQYAPQVHRLLVPASESKTHGTVSEPGPLKGCS